MRSRRRERGRLPRWPLALITVSLVVGCATPLVARQSLVLTTVPPVKAQAAEIAAGPPQASLAPTARRAGMRPLQVQLQEYLDRQEGTYGVHVIDLNSGRSTGVNADLVFPTASTFKLPLAMFILDGAARGAIDLDEGLRYAEGDWEEGTGVLQGYIAAGDVLSVRELVELAITESDNIATNMLVRRFGFDTVFDYMKKLGGKVTIYEPGVLGTTPREMAGYLRAALSSRGVGDSKLREFLIDALTRTAFVDRVQAGVPAGVKVAHKIGTLPGVVNDVALVFGPERQFIVAVFSLDVDEGEASQVIAEIARLVYAFESEAE